eukprot:UC1_evm1s1577
MAAATDSAAAAACDCSREGANAGVCDGKSTSTDNDDRIRPQFGTRYLAKGRDVFDHNAWDDVEVTKEEEEAALRTIELQKSAPVEQAEQERIHANAADLWDAFYSQHQNRFFKDRHWLFTEFPELLDLGCMGTVTSSASIASSRKKKGGQKQEKESIEEEAKDEAEARVARLRWQASRGAEYRILEVGCGAGNVVFPLLRYSQDPKLFVYACDYARTAVDVVQSASEYDPAKVHAYVSDISLESSPGLPDNSLDVVVLIFVLSALRPETMAASVARLARCLKPGGRILFRDYGHHDLVQLRFKRNRYLQDNFYIRGDGTRVFFFTQEYLRDMMAAAGLEEEQCRYDRRLIVNRKKGLTMHRCWLHAKFVKPGADADKRRPPRIVAEVVRRQSPNHDVSAKGMARNAVRSSGARAHFDGNDGGQGTAVGMPRPSPLHEISV